MSQSTEAYKRTVSGSIGAGMGSLFGGSGKSYYILEHKITSKYHKAGESQEIIVNQIELGRDPKCQVRFDESFNTVSRRHAAIVKDGDNWKLIQLSTTNPTFLNGRPVTKEWYLQNGDDIQLSVGGPKMGFIIPTGNKSTVGSIGLSRRLSLFRQQALKPYKTVITILCIFLVLAVGGLSTWLVKQRGEIIVINDNRIRDSIENAKKIIELDEKHQEEIAALIKDQKERDEQRKKDFDNTIAGLRRQIIDNPGGSGKLSDEAHIKVCEPYVYYVRSLKFSITLSGESPQDIEFSGEYADLAWTGTGFLLEDGRFVTARHVVEPWFFVYDGGELDEYMLELNKIPSNGGKIVCYFIAVSSSGDRFYFTNEQVVCNRSNDILAAHEGSYVKYTKLNDGDWACYHTNKTGGLKFDSNKSVNLERGSNLSILGFPLGIGGSNTPANVRPHLSVAMTSTSGLTEGTIMTTNTTFEHGNSGGPVFINQNNNMVVVGIVSAGAGRSTGFIVPISVVK